MTRFRLIGLAAEAVTFGCGTHAIAGARANATAAPALHSEGNPMHVLVAAAEQEMELTALRSPVRRMVLVTVITTIATFSCSSAMPSGSPKLPQRHHDIACSIGVANPEAVPVTMRDLLDHPERYADKLVRTEAFMTSAFEDNELRPLDDNYQELPSQLTQAEWSRRCPTDPRGGHAQGIVPLRSVWWEPSTNVFSGPRGIVDACNLRDVIIEGIFKPCETGHMGVFAGTIDDATYVIDR